MGGERRKAIYWLVATLGTVWAACAASTKSEEPTPRLPDAVEVASAPVPVATPSAPPRSPSAPSNTEAKPTDDEAMHRPAGMQRVESAWKNLPVEEIRGCRPVEVQNGVVAPMQVFGGYAELYAAMMKKLGERGVSWEPLSEDAAREAFCRAVATVPDGAEDALLGRPGPAVPGKPGCSAPGPHWLHLYPWKSAWYERWKATPLPDGQLLATVEVRWGAARPGELEGELGLYRKGVLSVATEGERTWVCSDEPAVRCVKEIHNVLCPEATVQACDEAGYLGRIAVYDPVTDTSAVFGPYLDQGIPKFEVKGRSVRVQTSRCNQAHRFAAGP